MDYRSECKHREQVIDEKNSFSFKQIEWQHSERNNNNLTCNYDFIFSSVQNLIHLTRQRMPPILRPNKDKSSDESSTLLLWLVRLVHADPKLMLHVSGTLMHSSCK